VGLSDVGAFLTQLPFKENAVLERIVREFQFLPEQALLAGAWDSDLPGMSSGSADGKIHVQTHPTRCRNHAGNTCFSFPENPNPEI